MKSTEAIAAQAAHGWSDSVSEWLTHMIEQALSAQSSSLSPDLIASLSKTLATFLFILTELTLLFLLIGFAVALAQGYLPKNKIKALLSHKCGYFLAALLGAITPFCSCSTIPFLKGLIRAKAGFGGIIVFLLASPLLNPIIIGLFFISFGLKVAIYYFVVAMLFSIVAGVLLERMGFARYIRNVDTVAEPESGCCTPAPAFSLKPALVPACCGESTAPSFGSMGALAPTTDTAPKHAPSQLNTFRSAWRQAAADYRQAFLYILIGVLIGSVIYGFVPDALISEYAGGDSPWAVPFAAVVGVPLYVRAEAVIPISLGLVEKGMSLGAVMAFIIGSAGASLTEVILLRSLFKWQIIAAFLVVVLTMAVVAGYLLPVIL
jgi:uncharacterized membrane protein YraQ (UPF0718 family)